MEAEAGRGTSPAEAAPKRDPVVPCQDWRYCYVVLEGPVLPNLRRYFPGSLGPRALYQGEDAFVQPQGELLSSSEPIAAEPRSCPQGAARCGASRTPSYGGPARLPQSVQKHVMARWHNTQVDKMAATAPPHQSLPSRMIPSSHGYSLHLHGCRNLSICTEACHG